MIWQTQPNQAAVADMLVEHILDELHSLNDIRDAREYDRNLAESVAACLLNEYPAPSAGTHSQPLISFATALLVLTVGRALWSIGEEFSARALFARHAQELDLTPESMEAIFAQDAQATQWQAILTARAVRRFVFAGAANEAHWVLDLRKLIPAQSAMLELALHHPLRAALQQAAGLWDATQGRGCLALGHTAEIARKITGTSRRASKRHDLLAEIRSFCAEQLALLTLQRGWKNTPHIMTLDLT